MMRALVRADMAVETVIVAVEVVAVVAEIIVIVVCYKSITRITVKSQHYHGYQTLRVHLGFYRLFEDTIYTASYLLMCLVCK
jgi:hypothetical protein